MFRPLARSYRRPHRRGTSFVLIVVVMISFAASVGVAFALFAGQTLRIAAAHKSAAGGDGQQLPRAPDPTNTVNAFLAALIYDRGNDSADLTNALRGHSLAASMYGRRPGNTTAWDGVGTFHQEVNFTQMMQGTNPYLRDPEYLNPRGFTGTGNAATRNNPDPNNPYIGKNAGYSYPDLKDFFLGSVDPATGQVTNQSFFREWLFGSLDPNNVNWTNDAGRLRILRPRPGSTAAPEHPNFPRVPPNADGSWTGDVQNWPGGYYYDATTQRYYARNDSLWMHIGLPTVQFGNRRVQPLVAPLIVPLDGLLNASAHGNLFGGPGTTSGSYAGYGPWEVNLGMLQPIPPNNTAAVITTRGNPQQRYGNTTRAYDPFRTGPLSNEASVAWNPSVVTAAPAYPTAASNLFRGVPDFAAAGFLATNATVNNHWALFNPTEWPSVAGQLGRTYPLTDIKRLHLRYAFTPDWYTQSELAGTIARNDLLGEQPPGNNFPFTFATLQNTTNHYRRDPVHANRALITPRSSALVRPKLVPNFLGTSPLVMSTVAGRTHKPGAAVQAYPAPQGVSGFNDFASNMSWRNALAGLGSVDLNRPLADYRINPADPTNPAPLSQPLSPTTMTNRAQADQDRQALARDIFVRLAAATGAALTLRDASGALLPPGPTQYRVDPSIATTSPQYAALRYLAQLSVNIVDYIDNDDVSTMFAWNDPTGTATTTREYVYGVEKPRLVINEAYAEVVNHPREPATGVMDPATMMPEMPKHPEAAMGNPAIPGSPHAHVRFWLELVNPTTDPYPTGQTGPLGAAVAAANPTTITNGAAPLWYAGANPISPYQIEIARANRATILPAPNPAVATNPPSTVGATWPPQPGTPEYATGGFAAVADIQYRFNGPSITGVAPNNGRYTPTNANNLPESGFLLVGPTAINNDAARTDEFKPDPATNPMWANTNAILTPAPSDTQVSLQNSLAYAVPLPTGATAAPNAVNNGEYRKHVVLLRRLANPYMAHNSDPANAAYNPYVTVDYMENVPAFDAAYRLTMDRMPRSARGMMAATGYDPLTERFSVGKVQPYAGHSALTVDPPQPATAQGAYNQYQPFPTSMVQAQTFSDTTNASGQKITFGRHNGANAAAPTNTTIDSSTTPPSLVVTTAPQRETIMAPFDWLVHMDRPLVNQIELFSVRDGAPYQVTDQFLRVGTGTPPTLDYEFGTPRWRFTQDGLLRALELLSVKPWTAGVAHGGRTSGQINVNAIPDKRVLQALLDPQAGNRFDQAFVENTAWAQWLGSRSTLQPRTRADGNLDANGMPVPNSRATGANPPYGPASSTTDLVPGATTPAQDRPFLPFGAPSAAAPAAGTGFAYLTGGTEQLTVLRHDGTNPPYLYAGLPMNGTEPVRGATYFQPEPVRKMLNNITTVNHTYAVFLTVGYFELDLDPTTRAPLMVNLGGGLQMNQLAQEAYLSIPGDLRQKFVAVIDMSNMALDALATTPTAATVTPFFTTLEQTARPLAPGQPVTISIATDASGNVPVDGQSVPIAMGSTLVLGYGSEAQTVTVASAVTPPVAATATTAAVPAQVQVTNLQRTAWAGSSVSNVKPGYPGPQPNFKYTDAAYKSVVPYVERIK